jgi:hypothetical protein
MKLNLSLIIFGITTSYISYASLITHDVQLVQCSKKYNARKSCVLASQSFVVPNLGLAESELDKTLNFTWKISGGCSQNLEWYVNAVGNETLVDPGMGTHDFDEIAQETQTPIVVELVDGNAIKTKRAVFLPDCTMQLILESQEYTQASLRHVEDEFIKDLRHAIDQHSIFSEFIYTYELGNSEIQAKLDDANKTLNAINLVISKLDPVPPEVLKEREAATTVKNNCESALTKSAAKRAIDVARYKEEKTKVLKSGENIKAQILQVLEHLADPTALKLIIQEFEGIKK